MGSEDQKMNGEVEQWRTARFVVLGLLAVGGLAALGTWMVPYEAPPCHSQTRTAPHPAPVPDALRDARAE